MKLRVISAVSACVLIAGLSACSAPQPAPTVTVTQTVTVSPTPTPTASSTSPLAMGETHSIPGATVTVHAVNLDPAPDPAPQPQSASDKWVAADVELCNTTGEGFIFSNSPWSLIDTANHAFAPSSLGYNQFPEPSYGFGEATLNAGECRRGWIVFVVNRDAQLTAVKYQNSSGDVARWAL